MNDSSSHGRSRRAFLATSGIMAGAFAGNVVTPTPALAQTLPGSLPASDPVAVRAVPAAIDGADPTGAADSTAGLQRAINGVPEGGTLIIPEGQYRVDGNLSVPTGRSISIVGYGATLVHSAAGPLISVVGSYDSVVGISSISRASQDFASGSSADVSILQAASDIDWRPGDVLKLVSNDTIPEARPGTSTAASRRGEFVSVDRVDGRRVFLAGLVRDSYATGIRAARVSDQTFRLEGVTFDVAPAGLTSSFGVTVHLMGLHAPVVSNVHVRRASSVALQLTSCLSYSVENVVIDQVAENLGRGQLGYGVLDNCSTSGTVNNCTFRYLRHAYTDDTPRMGASGDILRSGRTFGTKVIGCSAAMTTNNSFDTHHCSEGVEFINCSASGGIPREDQGYAAFGLRGRNHRVVGGTSTNMESGVTVFTEGVGGESYGHTVSNLLVSGAANAALLINIHGERHPLARQRSEPVNLFARSITAVDSRRFLAATNGTVILRDGVFMPGVGADGVEYNGITNRNSMLDLDTLVLDYSRNEKGKPQPILAVTSGSGWSPGTQDSVLSDVTVRASSSVTGRVSRPFIGGTHRVRGRRIEFSRPFTVLPGDRDASSVFDWRVSSAPGEAQQDFSSAYFYLGSTELASPLVRLRQSPDPNLIVKVNPGAGTVSTTTFLPGYFRGQVIRFWVQDTVSGTWKVPHGSEHNTLLRAGTTRSLRRGDQLAVVWDGVVWRELA